MLLIDGYNLLMSGGKEIPRRSFEGMRERLIERVSRHCASREVRGEIFFDGGGPPAPQSAWLTVHYVPDADAAIVKRIRATRDRTALTIVTNDREIVNEARPRRLRVIPSERFAEELEGQPEAPRAPHAKSTGISPAEADQWMKEFGLDEKPRRKTQAE